MALSAPALSARGRYVSVQRRTDTTQQVWAVDLLEGTPRCLVECESLTFHEWALGDRGVIYGHYAPGRGAEALSFVSVDGTMRREIVPETGTCRLYGAQSPDGRYLAYTSARRTGREFDVRVVDLVTGDRHTVCRSAPDLRPGTWRPDGRALLLRAPDGEAGNRLYLLDLTTSALQPLFDPELPHRYIDCGWAPDASGFYVITDHGRDFCRLAFHHVLDGTLATIAEPDCDIEQCALSSEHEFIAWLQNDGGYSRLHVERLGAAPAMKLPDLPAGVLQVHWARHATVAAFHVTGPATPGEVSVWWPHSGVQRRVTLPVRLDGEEEGGEPLVPPRPCRFTARDGVALHGLLYLPRSASVPPPVVVAVHGGPTAQARPKYNPLYHAIVRDGIAIFDLNYRGSSGFGRQFATLNDRHLKEHELLDVADAVAWLRGAPHVDGSRVAIMGHSYGGYLVMAALARCPALFAGGVAMSGVSDWVAALERSSAPLASSDRVEYGDVRDPDDREFLRWLSPISHVDGVRAPVLVIHGVHDRVVPVSQSDRFVAALRGAGARVEYLRLSHEGHSLGHPRTAPHVHERIRAFLARTLHVTAGATTHSDGNDGLAPRCCEASRAGVSSPDTAAVRGSLG